MASIKRIDHIAVVVEDLAAALAFWQDALDLQLDHTAEVPAEQSRIAFLPAGGSEVELVQPTTADSGIARYLSKRGPGMHHICFEVDDLAGCLDRLRAKGIRLINETPVSGAGGKKYAFIHPQSANGVLVELYELPPGG
jgi:methylmalonyl-CoA/ethylmalonyl-CoA epimerase